MRFSWYFAAFLCGAVGMLSVLRGLERVVHGGGSGPVAMQFVFGLSFVFLAARAVKRGRKPLVPKSR